MPRSTREWARRKLNEAVQHIDWTALHLDDIINVYEPVHPEISDACKGVKDLLFVVVESIQMIRKSF